MMDRRQHIAFTLVELLVVVAIIALLLSILLPALNKARDLAEQVVCQTNLRQINAAMQLYAADHKNLTPPSKQDGFYNSGGHMCWSDYLQLGEYAGMASERLGNFQVNAGSIGDCPSDESPGHIRGENVRISYGMNTRVSSAATSPKLGGRWVWWLTNLGAVHRPAEYAVFVDGEINWIHSKGHTLDEDPTIFCYGTLDAEAQPGWKVGRATSPLASENWRKRHNGESTNVSFIDGHVENIANLTEMAFTDEIVLTDPGAKSNYVVPLGSWPNGRP